MAFEGKNQSTLTEEGKTKSRTRAEEDREEAETLNTVSSHLYLKPSQNSETLDKDQILRRIRHRKRVNKVSNALQALLSSPFSSKSIAEPNWLDDAFPAP
ncbi:hypothetical protein NE237_022864 [Protea cynaroides]|uniref:Uncharacterized protein n=1 Tax=Protea cynaroides TaxID=273540 RepID=A0A9Q0HBR7_9MAGN|nr:hypothetical protein NE237_022864 [Protea cynaroides]